MALRCTLLLLAMTCVTGIIAAERQAKDSCMVHWIAQSGISLANALNFEQRMVRVDSSPADVIQIPTKQLSHLLMTTRADSHKLKSCFAGTSKACHNYSPCKHGGKCTMSPSKKEHVCSCPIDYTGNFCQMAKSAPLRDLRLLEKKVMELTESAATKKEITAVSKDIKSFRRTQVKELVKVKELTKSAATKKEITAISMDIKSFRRTQGELWKCHYPFVAHKRVTWNNVNSALDVGWLRRVTFVKKQENTVLRLLYSSNIREIHQHLSYWLFKIDGHVCTRPGPITINMYHTGNINFHIPSVLLGTCEETYLGRIGKGRHTITVHIISHDGFSGYASSSFLEIREICK